MNTPVRAQCSRSRLGLSCSAALPRFCPCNTGSAGRLFRLLRSHQTAGPADGPASWRVSRGTCRVAGRATVSRAFPVPSSGSHVTARCGRARQRRGRATVASHGSRRSCSPSVAGEVPSRPHVKDRGLSAVRAPPPAADGRRTRGYSRASCQVKDLPISSTTSGAVETPARLLSQRAMYASSPLTQRGGRLVTWSRAIQGPATAGGAHGCRGRATG